MWHEDFDILETYGVTSMRHDSDDGFTYGYFNGKQFYFDVQPNYIHVMDGNYETTTQYENLVSTLSGWESRP